MIQTKKKGQGDFTKEYILSYDNVNQTIIGSYIFSLINDSRNNHEKYRNERLLTLNKVFQYVDENKAWYDLWKTFTMIEKSVHEERIAIDIQASFELLDMFRLNLPYNLLIMGLTNEKTPILLTPPFYLTEKLLNFLEYNKAAGRKKGRELYAIQMHFTEFLTYSTYSFGLYKESHLDLLSQNGLNHDFISFIKIPNKLTDSDTLIEFIKKNRKYTMNPNGVVIDCYNCEDIEQVILFEQENHLLWKVIFKQKGIKLNQKGELIEDALGAEYCGFFSPSFFPRSNFSERPIYKDFELQVYDFILECYADVVCGISLVNKKFNRSTINIGTMEMQGEDIDSSDNKMGFRFIPRNTHNKIKAISKNREDYEKEIKKYFIVGHIRKLPEGHTPSAEALSHAQEFGIELPLNYTFVRPYEIGEEQLRTHYVKKI